MAFRVTVECGNFRGSEEIQAVKRHLHKWGRSTAILNSLQSEIKTLETSKAKLEGLTDEFTAKEGLQKGYDDRIKSLMAEVEEIVAHASAMDRYIMTLPLEKGQALRLRFVNGLSTEAIASKLYVSRATVFRWQDASLHEIADMMMDRGCLFEKTAPSL